MPNNWKTYKLGELSTLGDGAHSKVKRIDYGILYLTSKNFKDGRLKLDKIDYISENDYNRLFSSNSKAVNKPSAGDVLIGIIGTLGNAYLYKENDKFGISSSVAIIRPDHKKLDSQYLYYCITESKFKNYQNAHNGASVQGYTNLPSLRTIPTNLPPLREQKSIASILSAIDDKIENNLAINKTLEEMAMALYKHWFVDFGPFQEGEFVESEFGMIPKGWERGKLEDILEIKYGKDHKKLLDGKIPVYGSGGIMRYVNEALYDKESILIPRKGTLSNLFYVSHPFWSVDTMFYSKIRDANFGKYTFYFLKSIDLASMDVGSAVPSLTTELLKRIDILIPPKEIVYEFNEMINSKFNILESNIKEKQTLTQLRDTLLPKLISGEVRLKEFQEQFATN